MLRRLKERQEQLNGLPLTSETLAKVVAHCLTAAEELPSSREALREHLRPSPKKQGEFEPLWGVQTFEMVEDRGSTGIKCLRCGRTSFHPQDVEHRYCGHCHEFHEV